MCPHFVRWEECLTYPDHVPGAGPPCWGRGELSANFGIFVRNFIVGVTCVSLHPL